jgi:hypothetical protein
MKKSTPLIPQSVARQQSSKKDSDDEDVSDSFFTMDEPALKVQAEPMDIGPVFQTISSTSQQAEPAYPSMPTNQQYNMAGISDTYQTEDAGLELDHVSVCTCSYRNLVEDLIVFCLIVTGTSGFLWSQTQITR